MTRCKIAPPSCTRPGNPCCRNCKAQGCPARCENHPDLCGCWEECPPPGRRGRRKGDGRRLDWGEIARLRGQGLSYAQIAERVGCSASGVRHALGKKTGGAPNG